MKNIAILASGNGTNCDNIIRYFHNDSNIRVAMVLTNNPKAKAIEKARTQGVKVYIMAKEEFNDKEQLLPILAENSIELIVLAGFLLFLPEFLVSAYPNGIINIHPSLLPKYGGKGMYGMHVHEAVKANSERESGITIHYVNNEYDRGKIIEQHTTPLSPEDTPEDIATKVHALEYKYFPAAIEKVLSEDRK